MKPTKVLQAGCLLLMIFLTSNSLIAQVGINTSSPANGAMLDISSSSKGFLMPRVELTGTNDTTTITPSATTGVMVYNTVTAGVIPYQVTPGFYYWSGVQWRRLYNQGYTLLYNQPSELTANSSYTDIPGLDTGDFNIPFSGTYQIVVTTYYAAGDVLGSVSGDGAAQGSVSLVMDTNASGSYTRLDEVYVTSSSKDIASGTDFYHLGQQATIIYTVDLDVVNSYQFKVQGREWHREGTDPGTFGKDTNGYVGASGINDAQRGSMTICLVKQL